MTTESKIGTKLKAFCANCKGERNCEIKGHHQELDHDEMSGFSWCRDWYLFVCCGCEHVFAQSVATDSETCHDYYDCNGNHQRDYIETIKSWPAQFKRSRPDWFDHGLIGSHKRFIDLDKCLTEVYEALDHNLNVLAAMGTRTIFDISSEILGVDSELPFNKKLNEMVDKNLITNSQKEHLEVVIDAGGASAHRGWLPHVEDLNTLMDILESFIYDSFVLPAKKKATEESVAKVKGKVPPRKPRHRAKKPLATAVLPA